VRHETTSRVPPDERVGAARERVGASPYGFALVLSSSGVLLGRLRRSALDGNPNALAGEVTEPGSVDRATPT
jgi:hypothetical protein